MKKLRKNQSKRKYRKKYSKGIQNLMEKFILKTVVLLLIISLNWAGFSNIGKTSAYFFDNEGSNGNLFEATLFDFSITNKYIENFIGIEATSDIESVSVVTKTTGSLNVQYEVSAEKISGNDDFCNALQIELEHNGSEKHDGSLLSVSVPVTTQLGTWELELDLPASATNVLHGTECDVDLIFKGWRSSIVNFEDSGFTDEERINLRLTSRMVVLNEFLPNPNGLVPDYGFDFGEDGDSKPRGEWVELYNNSNTNHDLAGWYIWDASSDDSNKVFITDSNTYSATTIIPGNGWLVVYMNKAVLDNTGDTVKLFNDSDTLIDSYAYTGDNDYCEIEPTPEDPNSTSSSGTCGGVPPNKSYARIPDGIGYWVDPIPTPGRPNILESEIEIINQESAVEEVLIEEPISNDIFDEEPFIEEEPVNEETSTIPEELITEEEPIVEEEPPVVEGEVPLEEPVVEEPVVEEPAVEEEPILEESPITEEESVVEEETVEESVVEEESNAEETPIIEETTEDVVEEVVEAPVTEETPADEAPIAEEQPAVLPDDDFSTQTTTGESEGDVGSGDGSDDPSSLDSGSSTESVVESE